MADSSVTRDDLQRAKDEAVRLATAEAVRQADEAAHANIVSAVEAVVTNVTIQIGMSEKTTTAKIDGLRTATRAWIIAGLAGGQTLAAIAAAYTTGNGQKVAQAASALLPFV